MSSKLSMIGVRLDKLSFRKFHYVAHMNGRLAAQEGRMILLRYIARYEVKHGEITLAKLQHFEERLQGND